MAKLIVCDICKAVGKGRKPEDFYEVLQYSDDFKQCIGYLDLCGACYNKYNKFIQDNDREFREKLKKWIDEQQNLKGENDVSRN